MGKDHCLHDNQRLSISGSAFFCGANRQQNSINRFIGGSAKVEDVSATSHTQLCDRLAIAINRYRAERTSDISSASSIFPAESVAGGCAEKKRRIPLDYLSARPQVKTASRAEKTTVEARERPEKRAPQHLAGNFQSTTNRGEGARERGCVATDDATEAFDSPETQAEHH